MSMDEAGSESSIIDQLDATPKAAKNSKRVVKMLVRTHRHDSVYKQELAKYLDKLVADGSTVVSITTGIDIRGFEVVSYKDEVR